MAIGHAYGIKTFEINKESYQSEEFIDLFNVPGAVIFVVKIDPFQSNYPQILSRQDSQRGTISNALHDMYPPLSETQFKVAFEYFKGENSSE